MKESSRFSDPKLRARLKQTAEEKCFILFSSIHTCSRSCCWAEPRPLRCSLKSERCDLFSPPPVITQHGGLWGLQELRKPERPEGEKLLIIFSLVFVTEQKTSGARIVFKCSFVSETSVCLLFCSSQKIKDLPGFMIKYETVFLPNQLIIVDLFFFTGRRKQSIFYLILSSHQRTQSVCRWFSFIIFVHSCFKRCSCYC